MTSPFPRSTGIVWEAVDDGAAGWADAGVLGLTLPECYGGSGGSLTDLGAFSGEAARHLEANKVQPGTYKQFNPSPE